MLAGGFEDECDLLAESFMWLASSAENEKVGLTYVPERKRKIMTRACGKRTLQP